MKHPNSNIVYWLVTFLIGFPASLAHAQITQIQPTRLQAPSATTWVVNLRTDSGAGSLRQALTDAAAGDTITFDPAIFPPSTPATITLLAALPELTQGSLTLDGSNAGVILDGALTQAGVDGLRIRSDNNLVKGLQVVRFPGDGIEILGSVKFNTIGGDSTLGSAPRGQGNILTLNQDNAVHISGGISNTVIGNLMGVDANGAEDFRVQALAVSPNYTADKTVWIGSRFHGVWRSTNGGNSWSAFNSSITDLDISALAISPNFLSDQTVFVGTRRGTIYKSVNNGASWAATALGQDRHAVTAMVISPNFAVDGHVYAATYGDAVFVSTNGGSTWEQRRQGVLDNITLGLAISPNYANDKRVYALAWGQLFLTTDIGASWARVGGTIGQEMSHIVISPNFAVDQTLWVAANGCDLPNVFFRSVDRGQTWAAVGGTPPWCYVRALAAAPTSSASPALFVGDEWRGIFRSVDGGTTWVKVLDTRFGYAAAASASYATDGTVFVGQGTGQVQKTVTSGSVWAAVGNLPTELGNQNYGIVIRDGARGNVVGSINPNERNVVSNNGIAGVLINGAGAMRNTVIGNYIGTSPNGLLPLGNSAEGIVVNQGAQGNRIGGNTPAHRNIIASNATSGIGIWNDGTMSNTVSGNYIGLNANGVALGNGRNGLVISNGSQFNHIGGSTPGERNVVSGNGESGLGVWDVGTSGNVVSGNYIGTDPSGTLRMGNSLNGLVLATGAKYNRIGGNTAGERNLISGNAADGVTVNEVGTEYNDIIGNLIGTDASGNARLQNDSSGMALTRGARFNRIGGSNPGERNVISGNRHNGISIVDANTMSNTIEGNVFGSNLSGTVAISNSTGVGCWGNAQYNVIRGNTIVNSRYSGIHLDSCGRTTVANNFLGTNASGVANMGNGESGISIYNGASDNVIGPNNTIAYNHVFGIGVWHKATLRNAISQNAIMGNGNLGVDTGEGGNGEITPAVITALTTNTVEGVAAIGHATVEIYSDSDGEGQFYEGSTTANALGEFSFNAPTELRGPYITALTRDATGNTTEFSAPVVRPLSVSNGDTFEPDNACAQAKEVATSGAWQPRNFHALGNDDWIKFSVTQGIPYVVQTLNAQTSADTVIEIYDSCAQAPTQTMTNTLGTDATMSFIATKTGIVYVRILNERATNSPSNTGYDLSVRAVSSNAVVVIVAGYQDNRDLQVNINYSADMAYRTFRKADVPRDNIRYFGLGIGRDVDGDGIGNDVAELPTVTNIRDAIQTWAKTRGAGPGVPFYIYLVNHGGVDKFWAGGNGNIITASNLDTWLSKLELDTGADNINIIIEACKSGSFIDVTTHGPTTISRPKRVIVASTSADRDAWPSVSGTEFSDVFWTALGERKDLLSAFSRGRASVQQQQRGQMPWLDDNGDGRADERDGQIARSRGLGVSTLSGPPPVIDMVRVNSVTNGRGTIEVRVRDTSDVKTVQVLVFPPGYTPPPVAPDGTSPPIGVPARALNTVSAGVYSAQFEGFTQIGTYRVIAYAQDVDGNFALPLATTVAVSEGVSLDKRVFLPVVVR